MLFHFAFTLKEAQALQISTFCSPMTMCYNVYGKTYLPYQYVHKNKCVLLSKNINGSLSTHN